MEDMSNLFESKKNNDIIFFQEFTNKKRGKLFMLLKELRLFSYKKFNGSTFFRRSTIPQ